MAPESISAKLNSSGAAVDKVIGLPKLNKYHHGSSHIYTFLSFHFTCLGETICSWRVSREAWWNYWSNHSTARLAKQRTYHTHHLELETLARSTSQNRELPVTTCFSFHGLCNNFKPCSGRLKCKHTTLSSGCKYCATINPGIVAHCHL